MQIAQAQEQAATSDLLESVALPAIVELVGLLAESWSGSKAAERRAKRREEVRALVEASTRKLPDRAWSLWQADGLPSVSEAAQTQGSATTVAAPLRVEGGSITGAVNRIEKPLTGLQP